MSVPSFKNLKPTQTPPQAQPQIQGQIVGFNVDKEEHAILQSYANQMYNHIIEANGQKARVLEKPQIGLMVKLATYYYIQMFNYQLQMQDAAKNNPQFANALATVAAELQKNGPR